MVLYFILYDIAILFHSCVIVYAVLKYFKDIEGIEMTKRVYSTEDIQLQGWKDEKGKDKSIRIYPLVIKKFRKLAEILDSYTNPEKDEDGNIINEKTFLDVLVEGVAFAMETFEPALSDPEVLTDYVDWPTMEHILEVAGGIKLNDPNLAAAVAAGKN